MEDPEIKRNSEETAELTEKELGSVTGGAPDAFLIVDGATGEGQDDSTKASK